MGIPNKSFADYFTHDCDMRNDVKIKALRRKFSHKGYAVWCFLLEALTDSPDFELPYSEIDQELFAADFDVTPEELSEIVGYCIRINLLRCEDNRLFSVAHKQRFEYMLDKRERMREINRINGSKGGNPNFRKGQPNPYYKDNQEITEDNQEITEDNQEITEDNPVEYSRVEYSKEDNKKENYKRKNFIPPTLDEVADEIQTRGYHLSAEAFVAFYESKGWRVGSNPMKSWKSALVTWETRWKAEHPNYGTTFPSANLGVGERIEADGRRTYGTGKVTIPKDAIPRPSERYGWDAAHNDWILI